MDANSNAYMDANSNTYMDTNSKTNMDANSNANMNKTRLIHWYKGFGHVNSGLNKRNYYKDSYNLPNLMKYECEACSLLKSVHHPPNASIHHAKQPFECVYSDLSGISPVSLLGGSYYYLTFIDEYIRFLYIYFFKEKSHTVKAIKDFIIMIEKRTQFIVKHIFTNNGEKYLSPELREFFSEKGIIHDLSPPYTHEYNGIPECFNQTLQNMVRL